MDSVSSRWWLVSFLIGDPVGAEFPAPVTRDDVLDDYPYAITAEPVSAPPAVKPPALIPMPKQTDVVSAPPTWPSEPRAWLVNDELRTSGLFTDLAAEIVNLTTDDIDLQRQLLIEHCQAYGPAYIGSLFEAWEERAAIMEYDGGMTRELAEIEAAKKYHLTAWLDELR